MASNSEPPTTDVTINVPTERLGEFYEMCGRWLRAGTTSTPTAPRQPVVDPTDWDPARDLELASRVWAKFPERARAVFGTLIDNPGGEFTGDELARLHDIPNGKSGVAGVLAHPGRQLKRVGRKHHFRFTAEGGVGRYSMDPELAELFQRVRGVHPGRECLA